MHHNSSLTSQGFRGPILIQRSSLLPPSQVFVTTEGHEDFERSFSKAG